MGSLDVKLSAFQLDFGSNVYICKCLNVTYKQSVRMLESCRRLLLAFAFTYTKKLPNLISFKSPITYVHT